MVLISFLILLIYLDVRVAAYLACSTSIISIFYIHFVFLMDRTLIMVSLNYSYQLLGLWLSSLSDQLSFAIFV